MKSKTIRANYLLCAAFAAMLGTVGASAVDRGTAVVTEGQLVAQSEWLPLHPKIVPLPLRYLIYLPEGYASRPGKTWPLLLFLHGSGESGDDLAKVKVHGPPKLIEAGERFPFIIVSPQAKAFGWNAATLGALLDSLQAQYRVDPDRVYVTGLSMGGHGTWAIANAFPGRFAAIVPICGYFDQINLSAWRSDLPVWAFHGAKDTVVPPGPTMAMIDKLKHAGAADVRFTLYEDLGHDSWTRTYEDPALWQWLARQVRSR